MKRRTWI